MINFETLRLLKNDFFFNQIGKKRNKNGLFIVLFFYNI